MTHTLQYRGALTREQFLFYEMRTTATLLMQGVSASEAIDKIIAENLYQYPTEKTIKSIAKACVRRLQCLEDDALVAAIATSPTDVAKQICLYAIMLDNNLIWEFMVTVIGEKYRSQDMSFGKIDFNAYLMRLQEQNDTVASWSPTTIAKIKSVIIKILVENEYLDTTKSTVLNPVLIQPILEHAIREHGDLHALAAFNCLN